MHTTEFLKNWNNSAKSKLNQKILQLTLITIVSASPTAHSAGLIRPKIVGCREQALHVVTYYTIVYCMVRLCFSKPKLYLLHSTSKYIPAYTSIVHKRDSVTRNMFKFNPLWRATVRPLSNFPFFRFLFSLSEGRNLFQFKKSKNAWYPAGLGRTSY